jgi:hypothetical protein
MMTTKPIKFWPARRVSLFKITDVKIPNHSDCLHGLPESLQQLIGLCEKSQKRIVELEAKVEELESGSGSRKRGRKE